MEKRRGEKEMVREKQRKRGVREKGRDRKRERAKAGKWAAERVKYSQGAHRSNFH